MLVRHLILGNAICSWCENLPQVGYITPYIVELGTGAQKEDSLSYEPACFAASKSVIFVIREMDCSWVLIGGALFIYYLLHYYLLPYYLLHYCLSFLPS